MTTLILAGEQDAAVRHARGHVTATRRTHRTRRQPLAERGIVTLRRRGAARRGASGDQYLARIEQHRPMQRATDSERAGGTPGADYRVVDFGGCGKAGAVRPPADQHHCRTADRGCELVARLGEGIVVDRSPVAGS